MSYECILTEVRGDGARKTGLITLNRPKQLNALNGQLMDELGTALLAVMVGYLVNLVTFV